MTDHLNPATPVIRDGCRRHALSAIALFTVLGYPAVAGAGADDADTSMFSFSGFGTLGVVHSSEHQADFTSSVLKPNGAGYSEDWSAAVDSLIAAQVTATVTPQLSAVLQVISQQNYDGTYRPSIDWANIKYQFTPDISVRIGRTVLPTYLLSDTREVAYTFPWVRPPLAVYRLQPLTSSDGMDASYRVHVGELTNTVQVNVGRSDTPLPANEGTSEARNFWGISDTTEFGALTTHVTYDRANVTIPSIHSLFNAFRQFGPQGVAIADTYDVNGKPLVIIAVGASYELDHWFAMSEWSHFDGHSILGDDTAWYVSTGYRIAKFTPYITYSRTTTDNLSDPGLTVADLPPYLAAPAAGLNAALNSLLRTKAVQNTVSIGTRWDFMRNTDLKVQFDHTRIGAGSDGGLINIQPDFQPGGTVNVFSATVDFVF